MKTDNSTRRRPRSKPARFQDYVVPSSGTKDGEKSTHSGSGEEIKFLMDIQDQRKLQSKAGNVAISRTGRTSGSRSRSASRSTSPNPTADTKEQKSLHRDSNCTSISRTSSSFSSSSTDAKRKRKVPRASASKHRSAAAVASTQSRKKNRVKVSPVLVDPSSHEGVVNLTNMIIGCLQQRGPMTLERIADVLYANETVVEKILDALVTTPLLEKALYVESESCMNKTNLPTYYMYRDGRPLHTYVNLSQLSEIKAKEQRELSQCAMRLKILKHELNRPRPENEDTSVMTQLFFKKMVNADSSLRNDPLYKLVVDAFDEIRRSESPRKKQGALVVTHRASPRSAMKRSSDDCAANVAPHFPKPRLGPPPPPPPTVATPGITAVATTTMAIAET